MSDTVLNDNSQGGGGRPDPKKERRGINSFLVMMLVLLLGGVIAYQASVINSQRYFLVVEQGQLMVERGYFAPIGSGPIPATEKDLAALYAPVALPAGEQLPLRQEFNNIGDLDRHLFGLFSSWAKKGMQSRDGKEFKRAVSYVEKARRLSGLTEVQQKELSSLRGDISYLEGRHLIDAAVANLQKALRSFLMAKDLGTAQGDDVELWITSLRDRLSAYEPSSNDSQAVLSIFKAADPAVASPSADPVLPAKSDAPADLSASSPNIEGAGTESPAEVVPTAPVAVENVASGPVAAPVAQDAPAPQPEQPEKAVTDPPAENPAAVQPAVPDSDKNSLPRSPGSL